MSRIRTIKPEFWTDEKVVECSTTARLLFIGLWNFCDDYGSHPYSPKQIKMEVFPGDDFKISKIEEWLNELISSCLIKTYTIEDKRYLRVSGWRHQKIEKPSRKYPDPIKFDDQSPTPPQPVADPPPPEGKGMEGKGKELTDISILSGVPPAKMKSPTKYSDEFLVFWKNYPSRVGKDAAWKAWRARNGTMPPLADVLSALGLQKQQHKWQVESGRYVPNPATWLNQGRWADEISQSIKPSPFKD